MDIFAAGRPASIVTRVQADQPLTNNPNVSGFGQRDTEIGVVDHVAEQCMQCMQCVK